MPARYFSNFRTLYYNGELSRNIMTKARFFRDVINTYSAFYPYTIINNERADVIAHKYYGDSNYDWLVYFSNELVDPYFEWVMTDSQFYKFIVNKYGSIQTAKQTIVYYKYNTSVDSQDVGFDYKVDYKMVPGTWNFLSTQEKGFWTPVYAYDDEFARNEDRRTIKLIDNELVPQIEREISGIFK